MAGGGAGGGNAGPGDDSALNILWMILFIFLVLSVIWYFWGHELKILFLLVKKIQLNAINFVINLLPFKFLNIFKQELADNLYFINQITPDELNLDLIGEIGHGVGTYLRYPAILVLLLFSYVGFFRNPINKYRKTYDMHRLSLQERVEWPQINPVIGLNLVKTDLNSGPWAMGRSPVDFCKEQNLISINVEPVKEFKSGKKYNYKMVLDQSKANLVFAQQLGALWKNPEVLPLYKRAILAVFLARACREPKIAANLLQEINHSANSKEPWKLNFSNVDQIWPKYYKQRIIQEIIQSHAYEFTIFVDLLLLARQDGVLATADFLWLKPIDRLFWYVLNSTGRQTYFAEAAGVHAHFLVEKALGRPLSVPYIQEATKALQLALNEIIYVPSEEEKADLLKNNA